MYNKILQEKSSLALIETDTNNTKIDAIVNLVLGSRLKVKFKALNLILRQSLDRHYDWALVKPTLSQHNTLIFMVYAKS